MNRNLALLLSGQLVSQIGDKFHMLAVAFLVLKTTGSPARMGLVLFCSVFPGMLLGFISGAFLDRYSRKMIIIIADLVRGCLVSVIGILFYVDYLSFPVLLAAQVLISACTAFFDPAIPAIIPQIVAREELPRANSQAQFVSGISTIIGPVLGGLTVAWAGYLPVFTINAASYLLSAGFECFINIPRIEKAADGASRIIEEILDGCRYVYRRNSLMIILVMVGVIHFFVGSIEAVIPVLASNLDGNGARNMGYLQTCLGLGVVLSALYISVRNIKEREARYLFGSVFLIGLCLLSISGAYSAGIRTVFFFLAMFLAIGALIIIAGTSFRSIIQKKVEDRMMGRVFGFVSSVGNISIPLAMLISGHLMETIDHSIILAASGLVLLPISVVAYHRFLAAGRPRRFPRESTH